jgi:phenylalanine-4-hydroxylase
MKTSTTSIPSTEEFFASVADKSNAAESALRGDYSRADDQYVVQQDWDAYAPEQHARWRRLYQRQLQLVPGRACDEFIAGLTELHAADAIPHLEQASDTLFKATGWQLVAVPGLIPEHSFFEHLAHRRFPITVWLRDESEFDYIVEPDIFHDFFGHVPLLLNPVFADHMQEYGKGGLKAMGLHGLTQLARLYWYTVEFGLINSPQGLRAYGAGILSSGGEIEYCLSSPAPRRIGFEVERVMRTLYKIDSYQETYFVIDSFQQLLNDTAPDFTPLYAKLNSVKALSADTLLPGEINLPTR